MSANSSLACAAENGHLHVADEAGVREALKAARDDLIEGNVALVKAIAGNFFWQGPDPALASMNCSATVLKDCGGRPCVYIA